MTPGDAEAVDAAAVALERVGFTEVADALDAAVGSLSPGWEGQEAAAAGAALARFAPAVAAGDEVCRAVVTALRSFATELRATQQDAAPDPERLRAADERAATAVEAARAMLARMSVEPVGTPASTPPDEEPGLLSTLGHTALDVVGLIPVVGEAADVANAAWYGLDGDYVAAGLSLAAAIPLAGWAFTGGKLGITGVDTIKAATTVDGVKAWTKGRPSIVPMSAERRPYTGGPGEAFRWKQPNGGKTVNYHAHPADPRAPAGSNAASGPTYRVKVGNHHLDVNGVRYTENQLRESSSVYSARGANDTHIPYPTDHPVGWEPHRRVFVPNSAALGDDDGSGRGA